MSTFELYVGGPPSANSSRAMYPAPTFGQTTDPFNKIGVAAHKGPCCFADKRRVDFRNDHAIAQFLAAQAIVATDVLGLVIVPKMCLFLGFYYKVENPVAGLTLTPKLRNQGGIAFTAIDCSVAAEGMVAPGGGAIVTNGAVSLANALFNAAPDMLDMTVTAIGAAKFGGLILTVTPILIQCNQGGSP